MNRLLAIFGLLICLCLMPLIERAERSEER